MPWYRRCCTVVFLCLLVVGLIGAVVAMTLLWMDANDDLSFYEDGLANAGDGSEFADLSGAELIAKVDEQDT